MAVTARLSHFTAALLPASPDRPATFDLKTSVTCISCFLRSCAACTAQGDRQERMPVGSTMVAATLMPPTTSLCQLLWFCKHRLLQIIVQIKAQTLRAYPFINNKSVCQRPVWMYAPSARLVAVCVQSQLFACSSPVPAQPSSTDSSTMIAPSVKPCCSWALPGTHK